MIFKHAIIGAATITALVLSSCAGNESTESAVTGGTAKDSLPANTVTGASVTAPAQSAPVLSSAAGQDQTITTQATLQTAPAAAGAVNPPHGQPGHRCDIQVGAPLNSPAGNTAAAPVQQAQPAVAPAPVATPASGGSGRINPPHGQPGHDCAVAVGAPLP